MAHPIEPMVLGDEMPVDVEINSGGTFHSLIINGVDLSSVVTDLTLEISSAHIAVLKIAIIPTLAKFKINGAQLIITDTTKESGG